MNKSRPWPDSLFTRMFLIIAGLLLLSQLAVYWFFNIYQANPQAERLAQNWAQILTLSETLTPAQRQETESVLLHQGLRIVTAAAVRGHNPNLPVMASACRMDNSLSVREIFSSFRQRLRLSRARRNGPKMMAPGVGSLLR